MTIRDKLLVYIMRKYNELEQDKDIIRTQIKVSPMDSLDHYEVFRSKVRNEVWQEFVDELYKIILNCK